MRTTRRPAAAAMIAALLLSACGSSGDVEDVTTEQPKAEAEKPTEEETAEEPTTEEVDTQGTSSAEEESEQPAEADPLSTADAGLLVVDLPEDLSRTQVTEVTDGTFGTPAGEVEIRSVARAEQVRGMDIQQPEEEYAPADGEEFFVFELAFVPGEDTNPPPTEVYLESDGSRRLVRNVSESAFGQRSDTRFLASLPADGAGATLLITADGHSQTFDIEELARVEDPLTDTYLRRVLRQDLSDVVSLAPVATQERAYTADVRIRAARISPYVPTDIGPERWADEGRMWLIVEYEYGVDSEVAGWSLNNTTVTWQVDDEPQVHQEGRWWDQRRYAILDVPAEADTMAVSVGIRAEVYELAAGDTVLTFSPEEFEVTFAR